MDTPFMSGNTLVVCTLILHKKYPYISGESDTYYGWTKSATGIVLKYASCHDLDPSGQIDP